MSAPDRAVVAGPRLRKHWPHESCSPCRSSSPGHSPAASIPGSPAAASPEPRYLTEYLSPAETPPPSRAQWDPPRFGDVHASETPPDLYPTDSIPEPWHQGSPMDEFLCAQSPTEVSPARARSLMDLADECYGLPGQRLSSVSAELGLQQQIRSPTSSSALQQSANACAS